MLSLVALHLVVGDESPDMDVLKKCFSQKEDIIESDDMVYKVTKENIEDKYFWLYIQYGGAFPYGRKVYNVKSKEEEKNPRTREQVEINMQLFALYSFPDKTLYVSDRSKTKLLENHLKDKMEREVRIKSFFKDPEEFMNGLKSVSKIGFVAKRNLFNNKSGVMEIFPDPTDFFGVGSPERYSLNASFSDVGINNKFKSFFRRMIDWKKEAKAESLICVGRDDSNIETIFNIDSFIQKISLQVDKDKKMYKAEGVKRELIRKLEERGN